MISYGIERAVLKRRQPEPTPDERGAELIRRLQKHRRYWSQLALAGILRPVAAQENAEKYADKD